jgi:hypothetical protein
VGLAADMTNALIARGVPNPLAHLASEVGALAFKQGFAQWLQADHDAALAPYLLAALEDLRAASQSLS